METIITVSKATPGHATSGIAAVNSMLRRGATLQGWQDHGEFILFHISTTPEVKNIDTIVDGIEYERYGEVKSTPSRGSRVD